MRFVDIIAKKANGEVLTSEEIHQMINGFVHGDIPDYQMASMLMAILQKGMNAQETATLTMEMMHSGDIVDLSDVAGMKLDKHSTGGVGDTTTLVVGPLVAACGGTVAKMSGRGLGHTGGTLDKLESIPGTCIEQSLDHFKQMVKDNHLAVIGQSGNLVPADKKMYALRDVTATVSSIPLIASSIMSKKLASGADAIILDVKTGTGAFMRNKEDAFALGKLMVEIGKHVGKQVRAMITDMNQPLGMAVGNALEVKEAVELLSGKISKTDPLYEVCMILAEQMLLMGNIFASQEEARIALENAIASGKGLEKLQQMIADLGGDASYLTVENMEKLVLVKQKIDICAQKTGYVVKMNAEKIGTAAQVLGAGRATKEDIVDPSVGLVMKVRCGQYVQKGQPLCTMYVNDDKNLDFAKQTFLDALQIAEKPQAIDPMVYGLITE